MVSGFTALGAKILNLNYIFKEVEALVADDIDRFSLQGKSKFIKAFIVLRLGKIILEHVRKNKSSKILFYVNKSNTLGVLVEYYNFLTSIFLKLANILSINFLIDSLDIEELQVWAGSESGEGKEVRARLRFIINRIKPEPDIEKLNKLFKKYSINQTEAMYADLNTKLSLFLT